MGFNMYTTPFDFYNDLTVFKPGQFTVTIADIEQDDDQTKLANRIQGKMREKLVHYLAHCPALFIVHAGLVTLVFKLYINAVIRDSSNRAFAGLLALGLSPVVIGACYSMYGIVSGIWLLFQKKYSAAYAKNAVEGIKKYFNDHMNYSKFALGINFEHFDVRKRLSFSNGITGIREHCFVTSKFNEIRPLIIQTLKKYGLATTENFKATRAISGDDNSWKSLIKPNDYSGYNPIILPVCD